MTIYYPLIKFYRTPHSDKIHRICKPLEAYLGLDVFAYSHTSPCGGYYQFSNVPAESMLPWENQTFKDNFFLKHPAVYEAGAYLLNAVVEKKYSGVLKFMSKNGVNLHLRIVRKDKTGCHQFLFGTKRKEVPFNALFFDDIAVLNSFCDYFLKESKSIRKNSDSYAFSMKELMGEDFFDSRHYTPASVAISTRDQFLSEISPDYRLMLALSKQEKKCLAEVLVGKTAAGIASSLNLSTRTVESYINNLKRKTDCSNKEELINKFINFQRYIV